MDRLPRILLQSLGIGLLLAVLACGSSDVEQPKGTPGPGPSWTPQEAIEQLTELPRFFDKDAGWNATFDPYQGRWRVDWFTRFGRSTRPGKRPGEWPGTYTRKPARSWVRWINPYPGSQTRIHA